jgi:hypothetical protein
VCLVSCAISAPRVSNLRHSVPQSHAFEAQKDRTDAM